MRRVELELEHRFKNRFVGRHRLAQDMGLKVLGASRDADIRLLGDHVAGVHATLECLDGQTWVLSDMGSEHGTWVKKKPIIEQLVQSPVVVNIGHHHLRLVPRNIDSELFGNRSIATVANASAVAESQIPGQELFHQVVIRKKDLVIDVVLLAPNEPYQFHCGQQVHVIKPPTQIGTWQSASYGSGQIEVRSRLTKSTVVEESATETVKAVTHSDMRWPLVAASMIACLAFLLLQFSPKPPTLKLDEMHAEDNRFTRIIFDSQRIKEKQAVAKAQKKHIAAAAVQRAESSSATSANSHPAAASASVARTGSSKEVTANRVVNRIKAAGLGALIGKISKRAARTAVVIQSQGVSADNPGSGRALGLGGTGLQGMISGKSSMSFKLKGVQGAKVEPGFGGDAKSGALANGSVGQSSVGLLDDESEIEGGLDREVISRVIQSKLGQIRYCYERQLAAAPDLYGKVKVKFTIGESGSVITQLVGASSLNNSTVEGCILRRIAGWQFPKPKGGTRVLVSYPFLFKSTQ